MHNLHLVKYLQTIEHVINQLPDLILFKMDTFALQLLNFCLSLTYNYLEIAAFSVLHDNT